MDDKETRRAKREAYKAKYARAANRVRDLEDDLKELTKMPKDYVEFIDKLILMIFSSIRAHHEECDRVSIVIDYDGMNGDKDRNLMRAIRLQKKINGDFDELEDIYAEELA